MAEHPAGPQRFRCVELADLLRVLLDRSHDSGKAGSDPASADQAKPDEAGRKFVTYTPVPDEPP